MCTGKQTLHHRPPPRCRPTSPRPRSPERILALWGGVAAAGLAVCGFVSFALRHPHGLWDAWAIWNLRARFLYRLASY
ncbi:MAG: hypothetical protein AB1772_08725 [Candidatus Zixiibacteriota bacterium]